MTGKTKIRSLLIALSLLLCSCSTVVVPAGFHHRDYSGSVLIKDIPFFPQEAHQCGPASMAGVMSYRGAAVTPEEVAQKIYSASAKGTLTIDMVLYAQAKGLSARQYSGGWEDLVAGINEGNPLIVLVDYGLFFYQVNHFMVVVGYNEGGVIANSGRNEREFIDKERFLKIWEKTRFWTLLIGQRTEVRSQREDKGDRVGNQSQGNSPIPGGICSVVSCPVFRQRLGVHRPVLHKAPFQEICSG